MERRKGEIAVARVEFRYAWTGSRSAADEARGRARPRMRFSYVMAKCPKSGTVEVGGGSRTHAFKMPPFVRCKLADVSRKSTSAQAFVPSHDLYAQSEPTVSLRRDTSCT